MVLPYQTGLAQLGADPLTNGYGANVYCIKPQYGFTLPSSYFPKIGKQGVASEKIYMSDSGRRSLTNNMQNGPAYYTYALRTDCWDQASCQNQTMFSDWGAPFGATKAFDRSAVPGNNTTPDHDVRPLAFRHGTRGSFQPSGNYRFNALFFDGHVETMDDVAAANPNLWLPKGSTIDPTAALSSADTNGTATCLFADVTKQYGLGGFGPSNLYVVP